MTWAQKAARTSIFRINQCVLMFQQVHSETHPLISQTCHRTLHAQAGTFSLGVEDTAS